MIKKSLLKIVCLLLIIGLNWTGLSAVGKTFAFFSNTEDSSANTFTAGTLDLSLRSGQNNFVPPEIASNMAPGDSVTRDIYVGKTANSLPLKHGVSYEFVSGDEDFCNRLQLKIWYNHYFGSPSEGYDNRDMRLKYNGPLTSLANLTDVDFIIPHPDDQFDTNLGDGTEQWFFYQITFTSGPEIVGQKCDFKFVFESWQDNLSGPSSGFSDTEEIYSNLIDSVFVDIVLNEFLPNPSGANPDYGFDFGEDDSTKPQGEWIEIYNKGEAAVDLAGWYLQDQDSNTIYITSSNTYNNSTVIGANGSSNEWLVVYMNGAILDNDSETIYLYNMFGNLIDSYSYDLSNYCTLEPTPGDPNDETASDSCPTGIPGNKSYARIPDGVGAWVDPIPTPGRPNILESEIINQENTIEETLVFGEEPIEIDSGGDPLSAGTTTNETIIIEEATTTEATTTEAVSTEATSTEATTTPSTSSGQAIMEATSTEEIITTEVTTETSGETTEDVIEDEDVIEVVVEEVADEPIIDEIGEEAVEKTPIIEEAPVIEEPIIEEPPVEVVDETYE